MFGGTNSIQSLFDISLASKACCQAVIAEAQDQGRMHFQSRFHFKKFAQQITEIYGRLWLQAA